MSAHLGAFEAAWRDESEGRQLPGFVRRELAGYLGCGMLARGFAHVRCGDCGASRLVAFACKARGFCPSCMGRRMCEGAARLVDERLPDAPLRQWVLTLPHPVRYRLAFDGRTLAAVLRLFVDTVARDYRRRAGQGGLTGGVTAIQRASSDLRLNPHFHTLLVDGVYAPGGDGKLALRAAPGLRQEDVEAVLATARRRILRYLERRGILAPVVTAGDGEVLAVVGGDGDGDVLADKDPLLARLLASAVSGAPPAGPARKVAPIVLVVRGDERTGPRKTGRLTAEQGGFSLHAATHVHAADVRGREAICRYLLRPPLANERLSVLPDGRLRITLKKPYRDGTTAVELAPQAFMARLAALVPAPRLHLVRYHGLLAPRSRHRRDVVPAGREEEAAATAAPAAAAATPVPAPVPPRRGYLPWAELLKRTFQVDVLNCHRCGGRMKLVALVKAPDSVRRFLSGVGLPTGPPATAAAPRSPSTGSPPFDPFPSDPA